MKPNEVRVSDSERLSCSSTKIFIDNGLGIDTPGKRSPDGKFREYLYNRIVARRVTVELLALRENRTAIRACATLGNIRGGP